MATPERIASVQAHFPGMTESFVADVVRAGGGANEIRALLGLEGAVRRGGAEASDGGAPVNSEEADAGGAGAPDRVLELLRTAREGARDAALLPTELAVFQREGAKLSLADVPNGSWAWVERMGGAGACAGEEAPWFAQAAPHDSMPLHRAPLGLACVRFHEGTLSFRRQRVSDQCGMQSAAARAGAHVVVSQPERQEMSVYCPKTLAHCGTVPVGKGAENVFISAHTVFSSDFAYVAQSSVNEDGQRLLSVRVRQLRAPYCERTVAVVQWEEPEEGWEDLMPAEDKPVVVPAGAQLLARASRNWLVVTVSGAQSAAAAAWFVPKRALEEAAAAEAASGARAVARSRHVVLQGGGRVLDAHVWADDGEDGANVRAAVLTSATYSHEDVVCGGEELRGGGTVQGSWEWPSTDQAEEGSACTIVCLNVRPRVAKCGSAADASATTARGLRGTVGCAAAERGDSVFWLSHGSWPELDTVTLAKEKGLRIVAAPERSAAAVYAVGADGGVRGEWRAPACTWLSSIAAVPCAAADPAHARCAVLACAVRLDAATGDAVPELYVLDGADVAAGPALVVRGACDAGAIPLGFGAPAGLWVPQRQA